MNWFLTAFRTALLRRLKARGTALFLGLAVLLSVLACIVPGTGEPSVRVGIVLPEEATALEALLLDRSTELIRFIPTDERTLDRQVLTGRWDCGLVAHENFTEKLESMDTRDLFTLKTGPGSTVYPLVRETVAACLMELTAPQIAQAYLTEQGLDAFGLDERIQAIGASSLWVEVELQTLEGEALSLPELTGFGTKQILVRLTGVLAMLWGLYLTADLGALLDSPQGRRLRVLRHPAAILLPQALAALVPMALWAMILSLLLGGAAAFLSCAALQAVILGLGLTVPRSRRLREAVTVLLPFLALGSVLLEPVLVDTASLFPRVAPWLSWLPMTLFCRGCDGSLWAAGALLLEGLGLGALSLLPDRK